MAKTMYQGETAPVVVTIKDSGGTTVNPSIFDNVLIFLVHKQSYAVVGKFSTASQFGFTLATVNANKIYCYVDSTVSQDAEAGMYDIEIHLKKADANYPSGYETTIKKGVLLNLNRAAQ